MHCVTMDQFKHFSFKINSTCASFKMSRRRAIVFCLTKSRDTKNATSALDSIFPHLNLFPLPAESSVKSLDLSIFFFTMLRTKPGAMMLTMLATRRPACEGVSLARRSSRFWFDFQSSKCKPFHQIYFQNQFQHKTHPLNYLKLY